MSHITKIKNRLNHNWSLYHRVVILAVIMSVFTSLLIGLPLTRASISQLENQAQLLRSTLSQQASSQAADAIFSQDLLSLNVILSNLTAHPDIAYGAVYSLNNEVIAEQGSSASLEGQPLSIRYQNEVIGLLDVRLNNSDLNQAKGRIYALWGILSLLLTLFNLALAWLGGRWLSRRILRSAKDVRQLDHAKHTVRIHNSGELKELSQAIHDYHKQLQAKAAMDQALSKFMTPNSASHKNPANKAGQLGSSVLSEQASTEQSYSHAAILFLDFVDLEHTQKQLPPAELAELLNQYYFFIHQAAKLYNGSVDKFVGDGVMVLFGIPQADEKDAFHGVCTGLLIIGLLKQFNEERLKNQRPIIEFQLGLHTGMVLAGALGDKESLSYTAVGDAIYSAQRLCHTGESQRLLISKDVINQKGLGSQLIINSHQSLTISPDVTLETYWANELSPTLQALIQRQVSHISAQLAASTS